MADGKTPKRKKTGGRLKASGNIVMEYDDEQGDHVKVTLADMRKYTYNEFWNMAHKASLLPPDEQIKFFLSVARMCLPSLQSVDLTADVQQHVDVTEDRLRKLAQLEE